MCNVVIGGERAYETPGELSELLGSENLLWQDHNPFSGWPAGEHWRPLDLCMCPIDLKQTLGKQDWSDRTSRNFICPQRFAPA